MKKSILYEKATSFCEEATSFCEKATSFDEKATSFNLPCPQAWAAKLGDFDTHLLAPP